MFEQEENTISPLFQLKISPEKAKAYGNLMPLYYRLVQQNLVISESSSTKRHLEEDRLGDAQRIVADLMMRRPDAMKSLLATHEAAELAQSCRELGEDDYTTSGPDSMNNGLCQIISEFGEDLTEFGVKKVTAAIFRQQVKPTIANKKLKPQKSFVETFHYQD
jgi:hypothetical protein